ncbi:MAG: type VI secretion system ATPase TssH [Azonexus sp.]|jgi:type VI secretion system protein VasG|uniref:type VI secretion system ATPase TssH n=1 Tax=Azonexus sp. TaxID=1872668 RepID=UPI002832AB80|nr:type VI secretion system ATPase TssH [Azonexus sp.]MDR0777381.1 type VI secretion system ATPase TssH [Azonexus sp.]
MSTSLKTLISKLNATCRQAAERAASLCMGRGNYEVDLEHLLLALMDQPGNDLMTILRRNSISPTGVERELNLEIDRFRNGNTRTPVFSQHIPKLFEQAWLIASLDARLPRIRSGHLLLALLTEPELSQLAFRGSSLLAKVKLEELKHNFDKMTEGSAEAAEVAGLGSTQGNADEEDDPLQAATPQAGKTPALDQFTTNLTQRARDNKVDPVIGRDGEIRQMIDILMRRRQNNPILTGEAGVGKTAVVEGLALRIAADDVPPPLSGVELHVLDMGLLQAGASVKGEFENRLKNVIDEVKKSPKPIILFIDEAHTMIGAGGQSGQNDAANLLKPALARGELRTVAATTWAEYKKYFEKDAALARRFQVVKVEEPSESLAAAMLRGMMPLMEKHFGIRVMDEAVTEAVRLSHRYISGRQLPDKAISVLDTACAKVALGQSATPALIDEAEKRLLRERAELAALEREAASGAWHDTRIGELKSQIAAIESDLAIFTSRFAEEKTLVARILELRGQMEKEPATPPPPQSKAKSARKGAAAAKDQTEPSELDKCLARLRELQGESPMVPLQVDGHVVAEIVAAWTGIPLGKMVKDEIKTVLNLRPLLEERIIGQDHALEAIAQRVRTARANLEDPNKPKGVFLFVGPSGVGKTETALALADILYGGERKLITINMSEYQEAHSVSGLKGSPPGYVGYGEGGVLTEAVRRNPYSVVLLDEVEKAHPDVLELFFQIFDRGMLDDAEGREIDFRNTLIILTSNIGSTQIMQSCLNKPADQLPSADELADTLRPVLFKSFKPAFLGRMKVVPYYPISDDVLVKIIQLKLGRIRDRVAANHKAEFVWDDKLVEAVLARCTEVDSGARNVDHILNGTLLPEIAGAVLARMAEGAGVERIKVGAGKNGDFKYTIS